MAINVHLITDPEDIRRAEAPGPFVRLALDHLECVRVDCDGVVDLPPNLAKRIGRQLIDFAIEAEGKLEPL